MSRRWASNSISLELNGILEEAEEVGVPSEKVTQFVFFKEMEMNMEKEKELMRKEMEMEMKMEKELMQKEFKFSHKCEMVALKLSASSLCQRVLVEAFFEDSLPTVRKLETITAKEKLALTGPYPKMTVINKILRRCWPECGEKLLPKFAVNGQFVTEFPDIEGRGLLYGQLSERVHSPVMRDVFLGKSEPESYRALFRALADRYDRRYEEIDEGEAAVGMEQRPWN